MKNLFLTFSLLMLLACGNTDEIVADTLDQPETNTDIDGAISNDTSATIDFVPPQFVEIDSEVETIKNKMASASAVGNTIKNDQFCGETDQGCSLTATYFHDELISFKTWYGFTNGNQKMTYYLKEGQLLKVEEFRYEWKYDEKTGEFDYETELKNFEGHYYFNDGKLIHQKTEGHNRFENDELDPETVLKEEVEKYKSYFQN